MAEKMNVCSVQKEKGYLYYVGKDGNVWASDGNGIGVDLNWEWINSHKIGEFVLAEK